MVQTFKTVGELKEFLEHLPNDMVVVHYKSDMEKSGWFEGVTPWVALMKKKTHETWDRFDGSYYSYESYEPASGGKEMVIF